jgi:hypothetical protein
MSAQKAKEVMGDWDTAAVNANWGRNMLIASQVLGRAAGITWHSIEVGQELTVVEALQDAMHESGYKYDQLVAGMGLIARYLEWIELAHDKTELLPLPKQVA